MQRGKKKYCTFEELQVVLYGTKNDREKGNSGRQPGSRS